MYPYLNQKVLELDCSCNQADLLMIRGQLGAYTVQGRSCIDLKETALCLTNVFSNFHPRVLRPR